MRGTGSIAAAGLLTFALLALTGGATPADAAEEGWTLETVLKQLDRTAKDLDSASAEVRLTAAGAEAEERSGKVVMDLKAGKLRFDLPEGPIRTILCDGKTLYRYKPEEQVVETYSLAKHPQELAQYALLGFGTKSKDLQLSFLLTFIDEVDLEGQRTLLLELTPSVDEVRSTITKIQIWIDQASWMPAQQKMFHGGADTSMTVRYLNATRNLPVDKSVFKPKWPKGTKTVKK